MHILFISPVAPVPTTGGRTRLFNLLKELSRRHEVSALTFAETGEHNALSEARSYCRKLVAVPFAGFMPKDKWQNRLEGWQNILFSPLPRYASTFPTSELVAPLEKFLEEEQVDVVVLQNLFVVELAKYLDRLPVILNEENVELEIMRLAAAAQTNPVHHLRDTLLYRKLAAYERTWLKRFKFVTAVSTADASLIRAISPGSRVFVVPNGVDTERFAPQAANRAPKTVLFFGTLSYGPNLDGLRWFCESVWPGIRQAHPDAGFDIVGKDPPAAVREFAKLHGIRLVGFVPDIRDVLWRATLSVVPLEVGGGTRLKILEALAAGCPVVSTTVGAEGLELTPGKHLLIADDWRSFAARVIELLDSEVLRNELAEAGMALAAERYDWKHIALEMERACYAAAGDAREV